MQTHSALVPPGTPLPEMYTVEGFPPVVAVTSLGDNHALDYNLLSHDQALYHQAHKSTAGRGISTVTRTPAGLVTYGDRVHGASGAAHVAHDMVLRDLTVVVGASVTSLGP